MPASKQDRRNFEKHWASTVLRFHRTRWGYGSKDYVSKAVQKGWETWQAALASRDEAGVVGDITAIITLLAEKEWAEHCAKTPLGKQLEALITELHDEAAARGDLASMIEGMTVSVDVSTGDHDAGNRYWGTVTECSELETGKNELVLLVQDATANFQPERGDSEAMQAVTDVALAALAWIDAVPPDMPLPAMPGFCRDWADEVLQSAGRAGADGINWRQRAEAAEAKIAELEKQEPIGYHSKDARAVFRVWPHADGNICVPVYARPAPGINLAELVPDEINSEMAEQLFFGKAITAIDVWKACRAAMLHNIEVVSGGASTSNERKPFGYVYESKDGSS